MRALLEEEEEEDSFVPSGSAYGQLSAFTKYTVKMGNIVQCNVCGKKIKGGVSPILKHVEAAHFPDTYCYKCGSCDKEFGNYASWDSHRRRKH